MINQIAKMQSRLSNDWDRLFAMSKKNPDNVELRRALAALETAQSALIAAALQA